VPTQEKTMSIKTKTVQRQGSKVVWEVTQWHGETRKDLILFDTLEDAKKHVKNVFKGRHFSHRFEIRQVSRSIVMYSDESNPEHRNPAKVTDAVYRRRWDMTIEKKKHDGKWHKTRSMLVRGSNVHMTITGRSK
tara:strand:+ start:333 stop:734 length:402 start_codon:yes stop_codon:yes gene_type:complete